MAKACRRRGCIDGLNTETDIWTLYGQSWWNVGIIYFMAQHRRYILFISSSVFGLVTCHQPDYDYGFYVQFCYIIFTFNIICFYRHIVQRGSMAAEVWQFAAIVVLKGCLFVKQSRSIIKKSKWSPVPECSIHPWSIRTENRLSFQTLSPSLQTTRVEEHGAWSR